MSCPYEKHPNAGKQPMKATEVLKRYEAGERDFRRVNLTGQSFKGKNLSGANFSAADIRGANFTNAKLIGANFNYAKAGLQRRWVIGLLIVSWIFSGLSGIFSVILGYFVALILDSSKSIENVITSWVALIAIAIFFIVTIRKGLVAGLATFAVACAVACAVAFAGNIAIAVAVGVAVAGTVAVPVAVVGAVVGAVGVAVGVAVVGAVVGAVGVAGAVAVAVAGAGAGPYTIARDFAVAGTVAVVLLSAYLSWRALKGDERDAWIRAFAIAFAATGGTSFRDADLTNANFTSATLKSIDFRNATLTRTCWHKAKKLGRARLGNSILAQANVRELLITGDGYKKSYEGADLYGANLAGANLNKANLRETKLTNATLQDANLEGANL